MFYLIKRPRKIKSEFLLNLLLGGVVYSIAVIAPVQRNVKGNGHSARAGSTPSSVLLVHVLLVLHYTCTIVARDDLQLVVGTGFQLRLQCYGVSTFKEEV